MGDVQPIGGGQMPKQVEGRFLHDGPSTPAPSYQLVTVTGERQ
jgi:hypothetical protein